MKNKIYIILILLTAMCVSARAHSLTTNLESAAKAYESGDYKSSIEQYESILRQSGMSAGVLYNLGNAYTAEKNYGPARLCYERAAKLDPSSTLIENNLDFVISKIDMQNRSDLKGKPLSVTPDDLWFFRSVYNMFAIDVDSDIWAILGAVAFILFILLLADYIFTKQVWVRKVGFFGSISMLGVSVIFIVFSYCAAHERDNHNAVVIMASKVELLNEPSEKGKPRTSALNAGTKLQIIKTEGGTFDKPEWYNVRLNSDFQGWIKAQDVAVI